MPDPTARADVRWLQTLVGPDCWLVVTYSRMPTAEEIDATIEVLQLTKRALHPAPPAP